MKGLYGQDMMISIGKMYDYLGMILDLSVRGQLTVTMVEYLKWITSNFRSWKHSLGSSHHHLRRTSMLLERKSTKRNFDEKRATSFHNAVAQLLFACPREKNNIQTAVYFLTTRVRIPDEYNWGKLKRILRYVRRTINMTLIIRVDILAVTKWWVGASYMAHLYMRGHRGATISLGRGPVNGISKKHRINTKSSTEA